MGKLRRGGLKLTAALAAALDLVREQNHALFVLRDSESVEIAEDILPTLFRILKIQPREIGVFLPPDGSPYTKIIEGPSARGRRLKSLELALGLKPSIILTTPIGVILKSQTPEWVVDKTIELSPNQDYDFLKLQTQVRQNGYVMTDLVSEPGEFSVRGGIFDIFPSSLNHAIRIEFFGDTIEKIRHLDVEEQLSREELTQVTILPAREIDPQEALNNFDIVKTIWDDWGVPKKVRDEFRSDLEQGRLPFQTTYWIGCLYPKTFSVTDLGWQTVSVNVPNWRAEIPLESWEKNESDAKLSNQKLVPPLELIIHRPEKILDHDWSQVGDVIMGDPEGSTAIEPIPSLGMTEPGDLEKIRTYINNFGENVTLIHSTETARDRIRFILENPNLYADSGYITSGFVTNGHLYLCEEDFFGPKKRSKRILNRNKVPKSFNDINPGDFVIHEEHGVGKNIGLTKLKTNNIDQEFLLIEYQGGDKLYLPIYRLNTISKAPNQTSTSLDKLGGNRFEKEKEKAKEGIQRLAFNLQELYAKRHFRQGHAFNEPSAEFIKFEELFPFEETIDQQKAIEDVLKDLQSPKPMDRIICGDVGFGKTEVAMRAAFKCVEDGKQVAVLCPTTILAAQHEASFKDRMRMYPYRIGSVSRLKTAKEINETLEQARLGTLDILIGTHRILGKDVHFKDIGLIIIDEEQRFGVEHKEKLKLFRETTDVLTLTATPIPRSLQMSMLGIRDITIMATPPKDRLSIKTTVSLYDEDLVASAISYEISRGGQVFFLHNKIEDISSCSAKIRELVPNVRVGIAHGKLTDRDLEKVMLDFSGRKLDVLVCTSIIESGLDIPNANTLIVDRADTFGLGQLYQIRGRVGRSSQQAHALFLVPDDRKLTNIAEERLKILTQITELGSGFSIASHDLDIRGSGNIFGPDQSGHMESIGFELYMELLQEALATLQGKEIEIHFDPDVRVPFIALIPDRIVPSPQFRLRLYKQLSGAQSIEDLRDQEIQLKDKLGEIPPELSNLLIVISLKILARKYGWEQLWLQENGEAVIKLHLQGSPKPDEMVKLFKSRPKFCRMGADNRLRLNLGPESKVSEKLQLLEDFARQCFNPCVVKNP